MPIIIIMLEVVQPDFKCVSTAKCTQGKQSCGTVDNLFKAPPISIHIHAYCHEFMIILDRAYMYQNLTCMIDKILQP